MFDQEKTKIYKILSDDADIFIVTPGIAKIPANQTVLFEVVFNPNTENNLFARELGVYIFTEQNEIYKETHTFPMITSVRVMGEYITTSA